MIKRITRMQGLLFALLAVAGVSRAEIIQDMYSAQVPVADQSAAELVRASRLGLSEVLIRVSGSADVLRNPFITEALVGARSHLQRYAYSEDPDVASSGLLVKMLFDSAYITGLVIEAGAPVWTANRPVTLVWLVQEGATGRQFVNVETDPELLTILREEFSRRGVPVQLPLYDLVDTAALGPDQAWSLDGPALDQASARYKLPDILAGRCARLSTGQVAGEWAYIHDGERVMRSATFENEAVFLREGVALVAEAMAARYAVAASANEGGVTLSVTGVAGYADYAAIVVWLEGLELVERANIESVQGDRILLRVHAQVDAAQLASIVELNRKLLPMPEPLPGSAAAAQLNYQWQR